LGLKAANEIKENIDAVGKAVNDANTAARNRIEPLVGIERGRSRSAADCHEQPRTRNRIEPLVGIERAIRCDNCGKKNPETG
jgi:hypothetical protein